MQFIIIIVIIIVLGFYFKKKVEKIEFVQKKILKKIFPIEKISSDRVVDYMAENNITTKTEDNPFFVVKGEYIKKEKKTEKKKHKTEYNIGAKIVPAIGILSMVLGVGFFLKYSFDNNIIDELGRVILGFILGTILLGIGVKLKEKFFGYASILMGGGLIIFYLSASYGIFYDLYTDIVGLVLISIITIFALLFSSIVNSKLIAIFAIVGGFLNPFLSFGLKFDDLLILTYILILSLGTLFLAWKKGWQSLIVGSFIGTVLVYTVSVSVNYNNDIFVFYWSYLILFFSIFTIAPFLFYFSGKIKKMGINIFNLIIPILTGILFVIASYLMFEFKTGYKPLCSHSCQVSGGLEIFNDIFFIIGLIPAIFYLLMSKLSLQKFKQSSDSTPAYFFIALAISAISIIPILQFSGKIITIIWLVEAIVLAFMAYKTQTRIFLNFSMIVLLIGIWRLFSVDTFLRVRDYVDGATVSNFIPIFNERAVVFLIGALTVFTIALISLKKEGIYKKIAIFLSILGNFIILLWIFLEVYSVIKAGYITSSAGMTLLSVIYLVFSIIMLVIGVVKSYFGFRILAVVILGLVILKAYLVDIWTLSEIWRIVAFIILGVVSLSIGYYYNKNKESVKNFLNK